MIKLKIILLACILLFLLLIFKKKPYSFKKELNKCESPIETKMMKALERNGYQPYGQIPCKGYRIDIGVYYKRKRIAIECDGKAFHSSHAQRTHDETKNRVLKKEGWTVFRFTGSEINKDVQECIQQINKYTKKKS
ncbi:hypothetical protein CN918_25275 [Priestia megaterium]|nr:hypothetical protein CN918_25275 [Priestia megaterium]